MPSFLDELLAGARRRVEVDRARESLEALRARALVTEAPPSFTDALAGPDVAVIAEVKRASPSRGPLAPDIDAGEVAQQYADGGAAAISVLTEPAGFDGSLDDLRAASRTGTPTLRKDFVVDPYQVWQAREAGASAVLLIVAALTDDDLAALHEEARAAGLAALVEVHDADELRRAARVGARVVGVNARDLRTFELDAHAFARLRPQMSPSMIAVAESGVRDPDDVRRLAVEGADAVLVGESVVTAPDRRAAVAALVEAGRRDPAATLGAS
ncbi:MAG: indole-3-glycerol phosphate synthase TrpC [Nitriliruptoraceae bacterium]